MVTAKRWFKMAGVEIISGSVDKAVNIIIIKRYEVNKST